MVFLVIGIVFVSNVFAAQLREIVLEDDTVIYGNIIGLDNGIYKIKTTSAGLLSVAEEKVVTIRKKTAGKDIANEDVSNLKFKNAPPTDPSAVAGGIEALKRAMQSNPSAMQSIGSLQNDPSFMAVLNDPAIMSAVNSGDINALTSNPKFMKLLSHPSVRSISDKVE